MVKEDLKLFGAWSSPFTLRVIWALKMKEIEYEYFEEDLANKTSLLLHYNPVHKKVPVLVHNGKPVLESAIIIQYLDETWKHNRIMPSDPHDRAMAIFWAKFGDLTVLSSLWCAFIKQGKEKEEAVIVALANLKIIEELLKGKNFFGGENIGFLDLCLGWICNVGKLLDEIEGTKTINEERFPLLSKWIEKFSTSPIIKGTWPSKDRLLTRLCSVRNSVLSSTTS
ncbi:glutathione transferase [Ranunculus cassubicifolius]